VAVYKLLDLPLKLTGKSQRHVSIGLKGLKLKYDGILLVDCDVS